MTRLCAALIALSVAGFPALLDAGSGREPYPRQPAVQDYQIAGGTYLEIELRTDLSSNASRRHEPIEGRLLRSIEQNGIELIPAGAVVRGTVTEVEPAKKRQPGRLSFAFHLVEHPVTKSLASLRTTLVALESPRPEKGHVYAPVEIPRGSQTSVSLLAPLTVRIPSPRIPASR